MILKVETHIKKKKTGYYDELIGAVWHNTADLRAQYLGPKSLIKEKGCRHPILQLAFNQPIDLHICDTKQILMF